MTEPDVPLCGDPTCEGPGCRQSAIDAWHARQREEARAIVRGLLLDPITEAVMAQREDGGHVGDAR